MRRSSSLSACSAINKNILLSRARRLSSFVNQNYNMVPRRAANSTHGLVFNRRAASAQKIQEPMRALLLRSTEGQKRGRASELPSDLVR